MILNNTSSITSLVAILNLNCVIYIISQIFNNTMYIFNILPLNFTNNNIYENDDNLEKCINDYKVININSAIIICLSFIYFIYKCHFLRISYYNIVQFIAILVLNIVFNIFNIIYYYCFFDRTIIEKDCDINDLNMYIYFNIINIGFFVCNSFVYIYNLKIINQIDN